jgi:hypothetical protein
MVSFQKKFDDLDFGRQATLYNFNVDRKGHYHGRLRFAGEQVRSVPEHFRSAIFFKLYLLGICMAPSYGRNI